MNNLATKEWPVTSLKEIALKITKGTTPTSLGMGFEDTGINFIKAESVTRSGLIDESTFAYISEKTHEKLKRSQILADDILVTIAGIYLAKIGLVKSEHVPANTNQAVAIVRPDKSAVAPEFLKAYLSTSHVNAYLNGLCPQAAQPNLNLTQLGKFSFPLPSLPVQRKIAAILTAYDDLIENNRQRIALLEKMAEEIYCEWFVRLRFPGYESAPFQKGLPSDWSIKTIGELCSLVTDGAHASPPSVDAGKAMASVKDMTAQGFDLSGAREISEADFERLARSNCRPEQGDVLIAKDGSYLKHVFVFSGDQEVVILSSIAILRPALDRVLPHFFAQVLRQDSTKAMMAGYVSGVAVPRIILKDFKKMKLLIPDMGLMRRYEDLVTDIYQQVKVLLESNQRLSQCRDLLLNRLISGKLRVDDLDIQFPPSMQDAA